MNNNNNNRNNRRRGRGNRNQGGNGAQLNRIDSRARGNAPQMLDKYKKLAQDAHHNGDRVQMEYYLQFADHYFRVIADNKARMDEQRGSAGGNGRRDEREQVEDYGDDDMDFGRRSEPVSRPRYDQQDSGQRADLEEGEPGQEGESFTDDDRDHRNDDRGESQPRQQNARRQQQRKPRENRSENRPETRTENQGERPDRAERSEKRAERPQRAERADRTEHADRTERPERAERSEKPARARKPRKVADDDRSAGQGGIDSSILPPSIRGDDAGGDSGGTLETVD